MVRECWSVQSNGVSLHDLFDFNIAPDGLDNAVIHLIISHKSVNIPLQEHHGQTHRRAQFGRKTTDLATLISVQSELLSFRIYCSSFLWKVSLKIEKNIKSKQLTC